MKKIIKNYSKILYLIFVLVIFSSSAAAIDYYNLWAGYSNAYIDEHSACRFASSSSAVTYFIPTKTAAEWSSFINNKPSSVTLSSCCDTNPSGVYWGAHYQKTSWCGEIPPCLIGWEPGVGENPGVIKYHELGGSCGLLKKWRNMQCGTLYSAQTICHRDPCVIGIYKQSDWNSVRFVAGTYNAITNKCDYSSLSSTTYVDSNGYASYGTVGGLMNPTWGLRCGDGICLGEYCSSCPTDCGNCPSVCGNGMCEFDEDCDTCSSDCYTCKGALLE